jgi:hypothetical protein
MEKNLKSETKYFVRLPQMGEQADELDDETKPGFQLLRLCVPSSKCTTAKQPDLMLKTRPKQLLGSLPIAFTVYNKYL